MAETSKPEKKIHVTESQKIEVSNYNFKLILLFIYLNK